MAWSRMDSLKHVAQVVALVAYFSVATVVDAIVTRQSPGKCMTDEWNTAQGLSRLLRPSVHAQEGFVATDAGRSADPVPPPPLEIIPLLISGPAGNRVDLVFFSDGYLPRERQKFIDDAKRLAEDVSRNQTFNTVQPLLNFWAAYTPSRESGIGVGGKAKDTPFGLYRDGTELRGVYYERPQVARAACDSLGVQCDYPILLGNDPYYGGLGGDFTVITSSLLNGPLVLRHELGHSIIEVGEEYDGGFAYWGVNAAHNLSEPTWHHWLSNPPEPGTSPRAERSVMPMQQYPWTMLYIDEPWRIGFESSGLYSRYLIKFSLSGLPDASDLKVTLDGVDLGWRPRPRLGLDRWHYDIHSPVPLPPGKHELVFRLQNRELEGFAQLCSAEVLEFGDESEFVSAPGHYAFYPTFSEKNETSYRPTNDNCLMRTVTYPNFCDVCKETLWLNLLRRLSLIDRVSESCSASSLSSTATKALQVDLVPLAHLRETDPVEGESYTIFWSRNGKELPQYTNKTRVELEGSDAAGTYTVSVEFSSAEIRKESDYMRAKATYQVYDLC